MRTIIWTASILALVACGGGSEEEEGGGGGEVAEGGGAGGGEGGEDLPWEEEGEGQNGGGEEQPTTGPARITLVLKAGGEEARGEISIAGGEGGPITAQSGTPVTLQPGTYVITARITDERALIDTPTMEFEIEVSPGETRTENLDFPRSRVRLRVMRGGRHIPRARVTLTRVTPGSEEVSVTTGEDHINITPGRWSGRVRFGNMDVTVENITFMGGATQDIPINVN